MIHVEEISHWDELDSLRLTWNLLLPETRGASFLHTWDWLSAYARHFGELAAPRILVVRHDRDVLGILPLVVHAERNRLGRFRTLTYPLDDWGNFYSPIGPNPTATLHAGMQQIAATRRDFDLINIRWVPRRRWDRGRTPRAMEAAGFQAHCRQEAASAFVDFDATWDDYWASRSSKWRNNVRRSERKLHEAGEVRYLHYRPAGKAQGDADPRWELYDACESVAAASWQGASRSGTTLSHTAIRDFLRDVHETAVNAGGLDLHLMYLNERPAAFVYNYHYRGMITGLRIGFDPTVSKDGAGSALIRQSLETAYAQGDKTLDMGADYVECKRNWLTSIVHAYAYSHYPLSAPKSQLVRLKRLWENRKREPESPAVPAGA